MGRNLTNLPISASFQYLAQLSGSELTDGTGSLISDLTLDITGTATTASYVAGTNVDGAVTLATTADFATLAATANTASYVAGANVDGTVATATTASFATSASFATTASFALNVTPIDTGSLLVTGSVLDATITLEKGDASTFDLVVDNVANATSASQAETAVTASFLPSDTVLNINTISASFASFTSASIGYLQTITGSAKIIGDAFIILNNDTPTERYAGLVVQDSGSTNNTASFQFDGQTNDWFYQYTDDGGVTDEYGVVMFGPGYNTKGVHVYPSNNTILKGTGDHHIVDSNILDDGSTTTVSNALETHSGNASGAGAISIGGNNGTAAGTHAAQVGGFSNDATGVQSFLAGGGFSSVTEQRSSVIGGYQHSVTAEDSAIIGGYQNTISHERSVTLGGDNLSTTQDDEVVVPHLNISGSTVATNISASGYVSASEFIGNGSQLTGTGAFNNGAGFESLVGKMLSSGSNDSPQGFLFSSGSTITSTGVGVTIIGGTDHTDSGNGYSSIIGGLSNDVTGNFGASIFGGRDNTNSAYFSTIVGGNQNNLASSLYGGILAGDDNSVTGNYSVVIGGQDNTVSNQRSVVLGGNTLSSTKDDEAVVNHLSIYGDTFISSSTLGTGSLIDNLGQNVATGSDAVQHIVHLTQTEYDALTPDINTLYVIDGAEDLGDTTIDGTLVVSGSMIGEVGAITPASNTGSLDCSTGNYFTMTLGNAVDTRLEASNIQIGQTINLKLTNNATAAGTISFDGNFDFEGGTAFTATAATDAVDILTFISFDGTSLQTVGVKNFS